MLTVETLRELYADKLKSTNSHDAAFVKAVWHAYLAGYEDGKAGREPVKPAEADADGWIEWRGGNRPPLAADALVKVRFRSGVLSEGWDPVDTWYWPQDGGSSDIVAYRVVRS